MTIATLWGVVFNYGDNCTTYGTASDQPNSRDTSTSSSYAYSSSSSSSSSSSRPSRAAAAALQASIAGTIVQGLQVIWSNEESDILILSLNNEIPETFRPFYLGWDASFFPRDQSKDGWGTVHYAAGDVKKMTNTTKTLRPTRWKVEEYTHVTATWTNGVTQEGSSGASLVDASTGLAVGVLTGGPEPVSCRGGKDIFGTLKSAWERGLWQILSPQGPKNTTKMLGRVPATDGPGVVALPSQLLIRERPTATAAIGLELSDPPAPGEIISINATLLQLPQPHSIVVNNSTGTTTAVGGPSGASSGEANITLAEPFQFNFTSNTWNQSQILNVLSGDDSLRGGPVPFQIILDLSSSTNPTLHKRRVIQGLRLDDEIPAGFTIEAPVIITGGSSGIQAKDTARLVAAPQAGASTSGTISSNSTLSSGGSTNEPYLIHIGDPLTQVEPPGSIVYYNISAGETVELRIAACGAGVPLQVAIYNNSIATW